MLLRAVLALRQRAIDLMTMSCIRRFKIVRLGTFGPVCIA